MKLLQYGLSMLSTQSTHGPSSPDLSQESHLDGVLVLQPAQVVPMWGEALVRGVFLVWGVGGLWGWRGVGSGPGQARGAPRGGLVSLHQEGDGGGGAGKQCYCLVMPGLCHVYTIDLDRQQNQPGRESTHWDPPKEDRQR